MLRSHLERAMPARRVPRVRRPNFDFEASVPRYWLNGHPGDTHTLNALNFLFPEAEAFFARAVGDHADDVASPSLRQAIAAFRRQEALHSHEHQSFNEVLRRQGYVFDDHCRQYARHARALSVLPRSLRLAITAGAEHYTATIGRLMAEHGMLERCHPTARALMAWHLVEEIEHKSVAFDVLIERYPNDYLLRALGFWLATVSIVVWTHRGRKLLLDQDGLGRTERRRLRTSSLQRRYQGALALGLLRYLRPGFHPSETDDDALIESVHPTIPLHSP